MNKGLSSKLVESFPNITPIDRPQVKATEIPDPYWLAGFVEGEACFYVGIFKSSTHKLGRVVSLKFQITQDSRDSTLMKSLVGYLGCGRNNNPPRGSVEDFVVEKLSDITEKIIPFFDKYPLLGAKSRDYTDFKKVAMIMKDKGHLTEEGLEQIRLIKSGMNWGRSV